jgi:hypothetical protein
MICIRRNDKSNARDTHQRSDRNNAWNERQNKTNRSFKVGEPDQLQVSGNLYTASVLPEATLAVSVARMTSS